MFGRKIFSVIVALVLVGQVSVFAQDSAVGTGGSGEIPVSGSELQRQAAGQGGANSKPSDSIGKAQNFDPAQSGSQRMLVDATPPRIIPNLLFMGLIFWGGMKFAEYRTRANQQLIRK